MSKMGSKTEDAGGQKRKRKKKEIVKEKEEGEKEEGEILEEAEKIEQKIEREKGILEPEEEKSPLVVITGACGFIGSWAVEITKQSGWRVRACDLPSAFKGKDEFGKQRYPELVRKLADETVECDITKPETLKGIFDDADFVFHIAAILKYDVPWETLYKVNVEGTKNVFEEILKSQNSNLKRIVVWSTNGIFGIPEKDEVPIKEDNPARPVTRYALSKFIEEKIAWIYHRKYGLPVTVIRPTAVYGPRESYLFFENLKSIKRSKFIFIPANFKFTFPSVHAVDICRAAMHLAQYPGAVGEDYIINDDSNLTAVEVIKFSAETLGKPFYLLPPVPIELARAGIVGISLLSQYLSKLGIKLPIEPELSFMFGYDMACSNEKLKSTGFKFKYPDFREGMREAIRWYEEEGLL